MQDADARSSLGFEDRLRALETGTQRRDRKLQAKKRSPCVSRHADPNPAQAGLFPDFPMA
jgi:hypothetical protein